MTGDSSRCPLPEVLAAFVAGTLSGEELKMTSDHLLDCEDCRLIIGEAASVARDEPAIVPLRSRQRRLVWWAGAAAAAVAAAIILTGRSSSPDPAVTQILVNATPRDGRYVEPRLTGGFPWAPLRPALRSGEQELNAGQMKLVGAAGTVLEQTKGDSSATAQHAAALAHLVAGRAGEAAERLAAIPRQERDARIWSDLAAARYQTALQTENKSQLAEALSAIDEALQINPKLPEALFNRALIVERLGLRDQARTAWQKYLAIEPRGEWANEAEERVRALAPVSQFGEELEKNYGAIVADAAIARALARRFPQEARVWGESEILSRWAHAHQARDTVAAEAHLRVADAFGAEIQDTTGEMLLSSAVAAIERAGAPARDALAQAHIELREAQKAYKAGDLVKADELFRQAAARFDSSGSPAAVLASALGANVIYDQGRIGESREQLEKLLRSAPRRFLAHRAQIEWQLGLVYASAGRWGEAMDALKQSMGTFEQLNERNYASIVRELLAEAYDRIGDPETAWQYRVAALQELGRSVTKRLKLSLDAAGRGATVSRNWPVSLSLLGLQLELLSGPGEEFALCETLLLRARVARELQATAMARQELDRAIATLPRIGDPTMRERAETDRLAVAAILAASPREAVQLLTRAIEFHQQKGRRMYLADLFLYRGRAWQALENPDAAQTDFESGISELESQRLSISAGDERWGMFMAADALFQEAISLSARRGDAMTAFRYAERARARTLLESIGGTDAAVPSNAPVSDGVIVEYASLPASLMIFVVGDHAVRTIETAVSQRDLAAEVKRATQSAARNERAAFRASASRLHSWLLAPIAREIASARTLVIVPDPIVETVPFAALVDASGRYVVERHAVVISPSAAVFARLHARRRMDGRDPQLLVVTGPSAREGDVMPLTEARDEIQAVISEYGVTKRLERKGGDPAVFSAQATGADVIHFAGHAEGDGTGDAALLTAGSSGDDRLDVREIAQMHLAQTRTVVLAACNTARGEQRLGEGTISVARAFLAAGVPSVVATLWPIEDRSAATFFPRLHHHLARGAAPADALRATQLEWIQRYDAPPGMWAAVQIIGS
ncbi:MAG TPA: CHAT domain-containing protein [Thermoanaerobaculia bacterium]|nr:CHAT domain-containing protein [Thermoanaerobaculia bacterium]